MNFLLVGFRIQKRSRVQTRKEKQLRIFMESYYSARKGVGVVYILKLALIFSARVQC